MGKAVSSPIMRLIRQMVEDDGVRNAADYDLLHRFTGQGDTAAFHALLRRHGPMVFDVCRGVLGNEADAEDAFQATFLVLARKAASIRKSAFVGSWLHSVAYRTALRARAREATRKKSEALAPVRQVSEPDDLTWREVRAVLHEELNKLPERYRAALVMCYLENRTQDQAAAQLGLAKCTLKERLDRGRELLKHRLVRRGLGTAGVLVATAWPVPVASACSPSTIVLAAVEAAGLAVAGQVTVGVIPARVAALSEGVMKMMFVTMMMDKIRLAAAAVAAGILMGALSAFLAPSVAAKLTGTAEGSTQVVQEPQGKQSPAAPKKPIDPLESAIRASGELTKLRSAVATATWEQYFQGLGDKALAPRTKATVKIYFNQGKYLLRFDYEKLLENTVYLDEKGEKRDERLVEWKPNEFVVLWDGKDAYAITFSERIRPSGCMVEIYTKLPVPETQARFFADPARLQVVNVAGLIENVGRDAVEVSRLPKAGYQATCRFKGSKVRGEFVVDPELGFHVTSDRAFNPDDKEPVQNATATWKKTEGFWHVRRLVMDFDNRRIDKEKGYFERSIIEFDSFSPDAKVDENLCKLESLNLPANATTLDRRERQSPRQ